MDGDACSASVKRVMRMIFLMDSFLLRVVGTMIQPPIGGPRRADDEFAANSLSADGGRLMAASHYFIPECQGKSGGE